MKKIDAHSHIGTYQGWAQLSFHAEDLLKQMAEYDIEKTILCATDSHHNEEVLEAHKAHPGRFLPLVYTNPLESEYAIQNLYHYIKECGFTGVKMQPLFDGFVADDASVDPVMAVAEELQVPVFIHSGHPPFSLPWSIALLAERFPSVKVVMIHMGHGHGVYIDAALKMAMRYPNLYLEMSGMPMGIRIKDAYERVGKERILFGIDSPFHHPSVEIQKVLTCGLAEDALQDIFYHNAARLMQL